MDSRDLNELAAKIARLIAAESGLTSQNTEPKGSDTGYAGTPLPVQSASLAHPSAATFKMIKEIADVVFEQQHGEKACAFEPNDRPCDHCSMCSSRGF